MDFWSWLGGVVRIEFTSADLAGSLSAISRAGFTVYSSEMINALCARITVQRFVFKKVRKILLSKGDKIESIQVLGLYWKIKHLLKRPVLALGLFAFLLLNIYLPGRIMFVQVEGNITVPTREILEVVAKCGLEFGTPRREIRSEKIKNKLLEAIPQLQWSGVNTSGCVAIVAVREKQITNEKTASGEVSSIVASRDGVIVQYTATKGSPVCKIGQAVKTGEILISGYTDCGIKIQATRAEGEVYAKTERTLSLVFPQTWQQSMEEDGINKKYSIIFGKKRINLYNGSGISPMSCGKMYKETFITLPGGFILPVSFVEETWIPYTLTNITFNLLEANQILSDYASDYLSKQMVAGRILETNELLTDVDGIYHLKGNYACLEMIGQVRKEDIYGKRE